MSNILWSSSLSWWNRATSSIHSRHPFILLFHTCWFPTFLDFSSFAISSMRLAYSITDNTPPCLMLSFIFIVLVSPCLVRILAFRLLFSSFTILQFFPVRPFLKSIRSELFPKIIKIDPYRYPSTFRALLGHICSVWIIYE